MSVCVHSYLSYPACKWQLLCAVLYSHMWAAWLYYICLHYLIKRRTLAKRY